MKTIYIRINTSICEVPVLITFQGAPHDDFFDGEEIYKQLVNKDVIKVGTPQIRSVIKTH